MGRINQLQPNVFNMLAAGEVVERPASVVKELVENSLDAGANQIDIIIENGGIGKIQVSDNGIGILPEDMRSAFLPHATSKISTILDLDDLSTLGFRGEALASIASVSEVTLVSATKNLPASKISLSGGSVIYEGGASRSVGTTITIENLFFNTPARLKFLKKPASEAREVQDTVKGLILANPFISFSLSDESGTVLSHEGGELQDAICSVYGAKTFDKLIKVSSKEDAHIRVSGYVSCCDFTKPNRTYQTVIVNGRCVEDSTVQTAVERAYGDYLMKRAYPMFVIDIVMPFDEVDANVHPRKSEVRFRDKQQVFGAIYHSVNDAVNSSVSQNLHGFDISSAENILIGTGETEKTEVKQNSENISNVSNASIISEIKSQNDDKFSDIVKSSQMKIDTSAIYGLRAYPTSVRGAKLSGALHDAPSQNDIEAQTWLDDSLLSAPKVFDGKIIGQVFATYLLVERDEKLYVIDQHAAHERLLYDKIVDRMKPEYAQPLIEPYTLDLSAEEEEYLESVLPQLGSFGFEIKREKGKYQVFTVPEAVSGINMSKVFAGLFSDITSESELTLASMLKEKLCQQACKAAIKGGENMSREQIERVIKSYVDENGNLPAKCPHGRPAVIALEKRDFEKLFKRIV